MDRWWAGVGRWWAGEAGGGQVMGRWWAGDG